VEGAGGFEERRRRQRFKLALPVQLKNVTGITRATSPGQPSDGVIILEEK
jgi:hypothetical protein